jgi:cyclohexyl-isocyanide hydratase
VKVLAFGLPWHDSVGLGRSHASVEFFARIRSSVRLASCRPVPTDCGLNVHATNTFEDAWTEPQTSCLSAEARNPLWTCCKIRLRWPFWLIADRAPRWVSSVCTGSLLLGAAGLLRGYRAAVHWGAREALGQFGAVPSNERVHIDRNRFTRGGNYSGGRSWYRYRLEMGWREHGASNRADYGIRAATAVSHGAT